MKKYRWLGLAVLSFSLVLAGWLATSASRARADNENKAADKKDNEAKIKKNLAKLAPKDRKIAEQQKYCVEEQENRLGSMGVPFKVEIKGQPVFLCCRGCQKEAEADPDKTLAKVKELREKNAPAAQK